MIIKTLPRQPISVVLPAVLNDQDRSVGRNIQFLVLSVTKPKERAPEQVYYPMTVSASQSKNAHDKQLSTPALTLVLCGLLSACGDSSVTEPQAAQANASAPLTTVGPSKSATQLSSDSTVTVQTALALVTEEAAVATRPVDTPPAAANPDLTDSLTETSGSVDTDADVAISSPDSAISQGETVEPITVTDAAEEPLAQSEEAIEPDTQLSSAQTQNADNSYSETIETSDNVDSTDNADINVDTEEVAELKKFVSVTTPGFEGEILDDAIRIYWDEDPDARGYNVYRQAEYFTTVFDNEFTDTEVFDDDYYYEIQAFDHDDIFSYVATGLTVKARSFGRTDPDAPVPNATLLDNYELVFADEFNNTTLDTSKWNTRFLWGTDLFINGEEQYYVDIANEPDFGFNPFTFDGENLTINTIETPDELSAKALGQPYLSGIITSYDAFKFTYGYAETRAKFTHGRGYWPAFWLLNAYYVDAEPEIDIMEFIGHNQDVVYHTYHYFDAQGELRSTTSFPVPGIDYTADFHTFGVEWKPGTLIFYVDGIETHRVIDANVSQQEMYVIANQAVGGWWAGSPDGTTPFPGEYVIDYIRVYQQIGPLEYIEFDQTTDIIPLFEDNPGLVLPNKRPPFWQWPEGYPDR